jgi:dihydrofolate synthase/folylpolyglutamate synthase
MISENDVINFVSKNKNQFEKIKMSFFEYTVAMAFNHFANKVDIAIIETGLGGRLDSTNIITPEVSIITNIGYDHINLLGKTLEKIAFEKAGIIKQSVPVVIGRIQKETKNVFLETADKKGAPISFSKKYNYASKSLKGNYQTENINTAISALKILDWKISEENIIKGLDNISINTGIRGRWEQLKNEPLTICDTGHNKDGISNIIRQIKKINYKKLHFVFGSVNDKDLDEILRILPKNATYYFCHAQINRALNSNILKRQALNHKLRGDCFTTVSKAYKAALKSAEKEDLILIGGSTFVVAEVL